MAAYHLGMAPMPPPRHQGVTGTMANHMLDNPDAGTHDDDDNDENIDPRLQGPANTQPASKYLGF